MMIQVFKEYEPRIGKDVFVAPNALVLGQVTLGNDVSVWYGTVLRGDVGVIKVGDRTNIQDNSVVHVTGGAFNTSIGHDVTIGHRAIVHGCVIGDHVLIGMGAIVMDGARVGDYALVGAGALVPPGMEVPPETLVVGSPARVIRPIKEHERNLITFSAQHYVDNARDHRIIYSG
jgi:carbonic anhydrase/acetyltransferase-like protein (isoleucine patch superfamily)